MNENDLKLFLLRRDAKPGEVCDMIIKATDERTATKIAKALSSDFSTGEIRVENVDMNASGIVYISSLCVE